MTCSYAQVLPVAIAWLVGSKLGKKNPVLQISIIFGLIAASACKDTEKNVKSCCFFTFPYFIGSFLSCCSDFQGI
jgi:hypothetical protein